MEVVGITTGMVNSTYTSFGDDLPSILAGYIPAVPMVALAVAEAGRVPLASVIYHKHKFMPSAAKVEAVEHASLCLLIGVNRPLLLHCGNACFCEGFRMTALRDGCGWPLGPSSESLQRTNPREVKRGC